MESSEETLPAETGDGQAMQRPTSDPLSTISVQQLTDRVKKIRKARRSVMQEDIHFGTIPGTGDKPTLLKPGAELLCSLFQLAPDPVLEIKDLEGEHREYIVRGGLRHIPSGNRVGSGYGSCSTKESKYRYRYIEDATDVPVPRAFWDSGEEMSERDFGVLVDALESEGVHVPDDVEAGVTKEQGQWLITLEGKGENPDLADVYNTCLKMAKKRWLVDVSLTATGASEIFTQDLDDLQDLRGTDVGGSRNQSSSQSSGKVPRGRGSQTSSQSTTSNEKASNSAGTDASTGGSSDDISDRVTRYGEMVLPKHAEAIDKRDDALKEKSPENLADPIDAIQAEINDWPERPGRAASAMLDEHRSRLEKHIDEQTKEQTDGDSEAQYDDAQHALDANFDAAWKTEENAGWEPISEAQLNRMFAIAEDNGWDEAALNRLVKDELGWESKADVPYGDPYDEICEALEDDRLRYHMSRDPDTPDMFEEEDGGSSSLPATFPTGFTKAQALKDGGFTSPAQVRQFIDDGGDLKSIDGIGEKREQDIEEELDDLEEEWSQETFEPGDDLPF